MTLRLTTRMAANADKLAIAEPTAAYNYRQLLSKIEWWNKRLQASQISPGQVVSIEGEYDVDSIALFVALLENDNIIVPISSQPESQIARCVEVAQVEHRISFTRDGVESVKRSASHPLYAGLVSAKSPGLVLFTSGATGDPKAAVHDLSVLLEKFDVPRTPLRTLVFLHLDHIGGINTLLFVMANGGAVVVSPDRSPHSVCRAIESHQVELLPTSPTFLNLLLLSGCHERFDLSSLKKITYGTEPMPQATLDRVHAAFPSVQMQQTYGMTEFGILRSKSKEPSSLWVRVGGEGFQTKVVDGKLWVKAKSAMLGYLNAPSPFDEEGFLDTGDRVIEDGEWMRILGRESEMINVGGEKTFPAEVENVILQMEGVEQVAARGEQHPITGQVVAISVRITSSENVRDFKTRMRVFCQGKLPRFAVPSRVTIVEEELHGSRFKTVRQQGI